MSRPLSPFLPLTYFHALFEKGMSLAADSASHLEVSRTEERLLQSGRNSLILPIL
jgi:hypothetical protein